MAPVLTSPCVRLHMAGGTGAKPHQKTPSTIIRDPKQLFGKGWGLSLISSVSMNLKACVAWNFSVLAFPFLLNSFWIIPQKNYVKTQLGSSTDIISLFSISFWSYFWYQHLTWWLFIFPAFHILEKYVHWINLQEPINEKLWQFWLGWKMQISSKTTDCYKNCGGGNLQIHLNKICEGELQNMHLSKVSYLYPPPH